MTRFPVAALLLIAPAAVAHADETLPGEGAQSQRAVIFAVRGSALLAIACVDGGALRSGGRELVPEHAQVRLDDGSVVSIVTARIGFGHGEVDPALGFRAVTPVPHALWAVWPADARVAEPIADPARYLEKLPRRDVARRHGLPLAQLALVGERQLLLVKRRHGEPIEWSVVAGALWSKRVPGAPPPEVVGSLSID